MDKPPVLKADMLEKTAKAYARSLRKIGRNVYVRKTKGGWSVFDKGAYNEARTTYSQS